MDQGLGEADALPIAVREVPDFLAEHLGDAANLDDILGPLDELRRVELPEVRGEAQVLEDRHLGVERGSLREVPDALAAPRAGYRRRPPR